MGDGITTPFDVFVFVLIFAGIPLLLFGFPIAVLIFLSVRRHRILAGKGKAHQPSQTRLVPWLCAFLALVGIGVIVFLMTAVGFTTD